MPGEKSPKSTPPPEDTDKSKVPSEETKDEVPVETLPVVSALPEGGSAEKAPKSKKRSIRKKKTAKSSGKDAEAVSNPKEAEAEVLPPDDFDRAFNKVVAEEKFDQRVIDNIRELVQFKGKDSKALQRHIDLLNHVGPQQEEEALIDAISKIIKAMQEEPGVMKDAEKKTEIPKDAVIVEKGGKEKKNIDVPAEKDAGVPVKMRMDNFMGRGEQEDEEKGKAPVKPEAKKTDGPDEEVIKKFMEDNKLTDIDAIKREIAEIRKNAPREKVRRKRKINIGQNKAEIDEGVVVEQEEEIEKPKLEGEAGERHKMLVRSLRYLREKEKPQIVAEDIKEAKLQIAETEAELAGLAEDNDKDRTRLEREISQLKKSLAWREKKQNAKPDSPAPTVETANQEGPEEERIRELREKAASGNASDEEIAELERLMDEKEKSEETPVVPTGSENIIELTPGMEYIPPVAGAEIEEEPKTSSGKELIVIRNRIIEQIIQGKSLDKRKKELEGLGIRSGSEQGELDMIERSEQLGLVVEIVAVAEDKKAEEIWRLYGGKFFRAYEKALQDAIAKDPSKGKPNLKEFGVKLLEYLPQGSPGIDKLRENGGRNFQESVDKFNDALKEKDPEKREKKMAAIKENEVMKQALGEDGVKKLHELLAEDTPGNAKNPEQKKKDLEVMRSKLEGSAGLFLSVLGLVGLIFLMAVIFTLLVEIEAANMMIKGKK